MTQSSLLRPASTIVPPPDTITVITHANGDPQQVALAGWFGAIVITERAAHDLVKQLEHALEKLRAPDVNPRDLDAQVGARLAQARERAGLSLGQAATALSIHRDVLHGVECGSFPATDDELAAMARLYNASMDWITNGHQPRIYSIDDAAPDVNPRDLDAIQEVLGATPTPEGADIVSKRYVVYQDKETRAIQLLEPCYNSPGPDWSWITTTPYKPSFSEAYAWACTYIHGPQRANASEVNP